MPGPPRSVDGLLDVLHAAVDAVADVLGDLDDWGLAGTRPGQHRSDLRADAVAVDLFVGAGLGVLSEESGRHHPERPVTVVVDPLDGSTNAHRGIPWFASSVCAVDADGPLAAVVLDLPRRHRYVASRGGGARRDGTPIRPSAVTAAADAVVGLSGLPPRHLGWSQFRALGAAALDLCAVADGTIDAFVDCSVDAHGSWDYLGGLLVCHEAGAVVADAHGRDLVALDHAARRTPLAAATPDLLDELTARRNQA
ncbi:inositol monophosphatase family protein [Actinomarinicola tropica]|uniref:inositol monophosphatase family protein n=1 Tax=Actinomarinicola tropica TaxID=2789776 RepID=UPI00189AE809|nr:inositol monophosphatase family protein [Actinomarinicola tropica]